MGEVSAIQWTDSTFNPWIGCQKVGPPCDNCYAEALDNRFGGGHWGPGAPRKRTSVANWREPLNWNRQHEAFLASHGRRRRMGRSPRQALKRNRRRPTHDGRRGGANGGTTHAPHGGGAPLGARASHDAKMSDQALVRLTRRSAGQLNTASIYLHVPSLRELSHHHQGDIKK